MGSRAARRGTLPIEYLEPRTLLSESASAQVTLTSTTGSGANPVYHYSITVNDTGTTNIGTFWFAWLPGVDFLPSAPLTVANPAGWGSAVTGSNNQTDGSAIEWTATSNPITPGHSLGGFAFTTADSPAALAAKSPTHPSDDTTLSTVYSGAPFSDGGFQFTVTPPATTAASATTVVASQATISHGDSVTFTATVAPSSGSGATPTGSVNFFEDGNSIGTAQLQGNGVATLSTSTLPSGLLSITAKYPGDSAYSASTSVAITETVNAPASTSTTLTTSNASSQSGASVTLTATVSPVIPTGATPTGTVTFSAGGNSLGTIAVASDGTAQLITTTLPIGVDQITATYSGDTGFAGSASAALAETVSPGSGATTTVLVASALSIHQGDSVSFTATVAGVAPGAAVPTGTVTFSQDGNSLGSVALQSDGTAVLSTSALPLGSDSITASYGGDTVFAGSASNAVGETVTTPPTLVPTIAKNTLSSAIVAGVAAHGTVTLAITNATAGAIKGKVMLELFATTDGTIDGSAIELAHLPRGLNVKTTKPASTSLPVKIAAGALPAGSYTLVARVVDAAGNNNDSAIGGSLTVAAPFIALSETFARMTIPPSAVAGAKAHAAAVIQIINNGNVTTSGTTTVSLYLSLSGQVDGTATQIRSVPKSLRIRPGKSVTLSISVKQIPVVAAGAYIVIARIVDSSGAVTQVTSSVVNITTE